VNPDQIGDSVETFVRDQFNVSDSDPGFDREVDLFDGGYVDSIGVAELLEYVTQEFGVDIPESDLFSDEFSSIEGIASIVARLQRS
jgi:acyl carrier protein